MNHDATAAGTQARERGDAKMFSVPSGNVIQSDSGFMVVRLGRAGLEYREGEKVMHVDAEMLHSNGFELFTNSIRSWQPPYERETVTAAKRQQIVENICAAMSFVGEVVHLT
jgi:hypothetical protein